MVIFLSSEGRREAAAGNTNVLQGQKRNSKGRKNLTVNQVNQTHK